MRATPRYVLAVVAVVVFGALAAPAGAGGSRDRFPVQPRHGNGIATFELHYESFGVGDGGGDQLYLYGPRHTSCRGQVVQEPTGEDEGRQRILIGPRVPDLNDRPRTYTFRPDFPDKPRRRVWCRGLYKGKIQYEGDDGVSLVGRFFFRVR